MSKRRERRARIAIPVRLICRDSLGRPKAESACTLDVTSRGARLSGIHIAMNPGDVVRIERGKSRASYQVCWVGRREDGRYGQLGVQRVESTHFDWGVPLSDVEDDSYETLRRASNGVGRRERSARYQCGGQVEIAVEGRKWRLIGELRDISAMGCYVRMGFPPEPRSRVKLKIRVPAHATEIFAKGNVATADKGFGMWVNFTGIDGDRTAALEALLSKLHTMIA